MGWPTKDLGLLCEILDSQRKPITKKNRIEGSYPYYGATGILDYVEGFLFDEDLVLIGEDGAKWGAGDNSAFSISGKTWVNNHAHVVKPCREQILDAWLVYYLNGTDLSDFITGMTVPKLNQGKLKEIPVPLPPISEQKRIVAILDQAFADIDRTRELTEKNLKNTRELFESYLQQAFSQRGEGWVEKRLQDVCVLQRGYDLPKRERKVGNYSLVSSSGVSDTHIEYKVSGPGVVTGRSGSIGNVFFIEDNFWPLNTTLYVKEFYGNDEKFICWLLRYFDLNRFTSGAGVPTLNRNFVHDEAVRVPLDIIVQKKLVVQIELLEREIKFVTNLYEEKLIALDELKKSLLQKAFSGELTQTIDTTTAEFAANFIAFAYFQHKQAHRDKSFGHVKTQKLLHFVESIACIELGRNPYKDAAGPNDKKHFDVIKSWAKENLFFEFEEKQGGGYRFIELERYSELLEQAHETLVHYKMELEKIVNLFINKNKEESEALATVHAAWNNLIIDNKEITEENILFEAIDNWHPDKQNLDRKLFIQAIQEIKDKDIVPDGTAKYVGGQESLF